MIGPVLVGMESSGRTRDALIARGVDAISCDLLPTTSPGPHIEGDLFHNLQRDHRSGRPWAAGLFHPTCTYHVVSAAWAFPDPDFDRYPDKGGYHQRVKAGTKTGAERRAARDEAEADLERIRLAPLDLKLVENPRGTISTRLPGYGRPCDVVQPYEFGDDASKATCLWAFDREGRKVPLHLPRDPAAYVAPRWVETATGPRPRWGNQTDSGQNRESPGDDRWSVRSETYPGIAAALADALFTFCKIRQAR